VTVSRQAGRQAGRRRTLSVILVGILLLLCGVEVEQEGEVLPLVI